MGAVITAPLFTFPTYTFAQSNVALPSGGPEDGEPTGDLFQTGGGNTPISDTGVNSVAPEGLIDDQAAQVLSPQNNTATPGLVDAVGNITQGGLACSGAIVLRNILTSAISSAISGIAQTVVGGIVGGLVADQVLTTYDPSSQHQLGEVRARSGTYTIGGIYTSPGWDSIAWCIVNAMIEHITNSTIAWANSGFNGNPAFIQNPGRFFSDIADYQAGKIISDIAYGSTRGGVNICQPFRVSIAIGLAQSYRSNAPSALDQLYSGMSCRLSDITQNNFFGGVRVGVSSSANGLAGNAVERAGRAGYISWSDWVAVTQQDTNNPYGAYILANQALNTAVQARESEIRFEVGLNNGWLNFKKCSDPEDPASCNITTPGRLIESSLNQTLGLSKERLVMADKFDEMITAIVNNLIRVSLNKVLDQNE